MDDAVDYVFEALFAVTDLRVLLRETAPFHKLNEQQLSEARIALEKAKNALNRLEAEIKI